MGTDPPRRARGWVRRPAGLAPGGLFALRRGSRSCVIVYSVGRSGQHLVLCDPVLSHLARWRQTRWYHREAGGQLFARFEPGRILIKKATGPRWTDRRTRHTYEPDRRAEQREIEAHHSRGLHFVGDWHTHAEPIPTPSTLDIVSMRTRSVDQPTPSARSCSSSWAKRQCLRASMFQFMTASARTSFTIRSEQGLNPRTVHYPNSFSRQNDRYNRRTGSRYPVSAPNFPSRRSASARQVERSTTVSLRKVITF